MAPVAERHLRAIAPVAAAVEAVYGTRLRALAVFGSVARGTAADDSDIDLLVVAAGLPAGRVARAAEFARVEDAVSQALPDVPLLSPVFKTPDELALGSPLLLDMVEDARILIDRDGALGRELARLSARLGETGSLMASPPVRDVWE